MNLPDPPRRRRRLWLAVGGLGLFALLLAIPVMVPAWRAAEPAFTPGQAPAGTLSLPGGLPVLALNGTPAAMGQAAGILVGEQLRPLLQLTRLRMLVVRATTEAELDAAIPAPYREELDAIAAAMDVPAEGLRASNLLVDTHCSALIAPATADRPLMVARNMDFAPAGALGPNTVLTVWRRDGVHPVAAVGWPGYAGVVSGMNDTGLTACILLNHTGAKHPGGVPLAFRVRELLETCTSVDEAAARFLATPVACGHYVLLADATTTALVWQGIDGTLCRDDPTGGWLAAANGGRADGLPLDVRGRCLWTLSAACRQGGQTPDAAWLRRSLTASFMVGINAQAMLFVPGTRELQLATGTGRHPAARQEWRSIDLASAFAGGTLTPPAALGRPEPLPHYTTSGDQAND